MGTFTWYFLDPLDNEAGQRMLPPFHKFKKLGSDTLNDLSRAIQLKSDEAELQTQMAHLMPQ